MATEARRSDAARRMRGLEQICKRLGRQAAPEPASDGVDSLPASLTFLRFALVAGTALGTLVAAVMCTLAALLVAACGNATPTDLPGEGVLPNVTPIAPSGWTTYANTAFHYSIEYPANWFISDKSPTQQDVEIYNFDQSQVNGTGDIPQPPYNKYTIDAYVNPNNFSMPDFYTQYEQTDPTSPPASSQTQHPATVAGRASLEVIQQPVQWSGGKIAYPGITYFVPDAGHVLIIGELYSIGGQPSAVFAHMIGSLKIGK